MRIILPLVAVPALVLMPISCGGDGAGDSPDPGSPPVVIFTGVTVTGSTDTKATVTVNGLADADGVEDSAWTATLAMDGIQLPAYSPGAGYAASLTVLAVDAENLTRTQVIEVEVGP